MNFLCPSGGGMEQNYLSIEDILMSSEKLPCRFRVPVKGLGFLDTSSNKKDISPNTKMDLPFWLAKNLAQNRRNFVTADFTKQYKDTYREILKADANVVDLHKLGPYYYAFGQQLLTLNHNEIIPLSNTLVAAFSDRFRMIMDWSGNALNHDTSKLIKCMDEVERDLFNQGQSSLNKFQKWEVGESRNLEVSKMVSRLRKRKRDAE